MYNKNTITKFITKYYLNDTVPSALLVSKDDNLHSVFRNSEGNLRGEITLENIALPEGMIGVYSTKNLLGMISVLEDDIEVNFKGVNNDNTIVSLEMSDNKGKKTSFNASPLSNIDYDGKIGTLKNYDVSIELNSEIINDFLKCASAIEAKTITFRQKDEKLFALFGYTGSETDQIEIELNGKVDDDFDVISFPAQEIKNILTINQKSFDKSELNISLKGVLKFLFEEENLKVEYWLRKNN